MSIIVLTDIQQSGDDVLISGTVNGNNRQARTSASELAKLPTAAAQIDVLLTTLSQSQTLSLVLPVIRRTDQTITLTLSSDSVTSGGSVVGTVTLSTASPLVDRVIFIGASPSTLVSVPVSITIPKGLLTSTFSVSTNFANAGAGIITASLGSLIQLASLTVFSPIPVLASLVVPATVVRGTPFTITVTISSGTNPLALFGHTIILYASVVNPKSNSNIMPTIPAGILIPRGGVSASVSILTDATNSGTYKIVASYGGVTKTALIVIT